MDITDLAPFTRVACPECGEITRVKLEFGPYVLERRLSKGGMSVLFVARDTLLDREVALKILNEEYSNDEKRITAFEEEARVTASLSHPNIVRVLTTGRAFGRFFIAMELVPGGHFEHHIRTEGRIPEGRMLKLAIQIAGGLKAAHEAKLIHRDIKPGNILLDADGNAKIVDFGLALVTQGGIARAKEFWATPYYVPPEAVEGHAEDFRSDIYAFGATLYHALAGKPPCDEESMAVDRLRAAKKHIVPLHVACPDLSMAICTIVDKAMAYRPLDRYQSYDSLLTDLQDAANHSKHGLIRETAGEVTSRHARARQMKRLLMASAGLIAGLLVIGALAWLVRRDDGEALPEPPLAQVEAGQNVDAVAADLAASYEEARDALARRSFATAVERFDKLFNHPDLMEPTRTWAGVQALVAAMLDEDATRTRLLGEALGRHLDSVENGDPEIAAALAPVCDWITSDGTLAGVRAPESSRGAIALLPWLILGIHEWQHGDPRKAAEFFTQALAVPGEPGVEWYAIYREIAQDHLADLDLLDHPAYGSNPERAEAATEALAALTDLREKVRTRGPISELLREDIRRMSALRAAFEAPDDDVEDEPVLIEQPPAEAPETTEMPEEVPVVETPPPPPERIDREGIAERISQYRFRQARLAIRELEDDALSVPARAAWMRVARGAELFIETLNGDVEAGKLPIQSVRTKDEVILEGIRLHPDGGLADADGNRIRWSEIHADSLIDWHRARVSALSEEDRIRAHEVAVAFDLLAGNPERALGAIRHLSEVNEDFERYWKRILQDYPR